MREIKFRVWNKLLKRFCLDTEDGYFGQEEEFPNGIFIISSWGSNDVIQQFTGLRDKNGREVYEGDILKVKSYDGWSDKSGFYYNAEVFYCCCLARFRYTARVRDYISGTDLCPESEIEVIGNIFENKNLLAENPEL